MDSMKRFVAVSIVVCLVIVFSSCKKTTTCTYVDPVTGEVLTNEVTTNKSIHEEAVEQHTKNGWTCD